MDMFSLGGRVRNPLAILLLLAVFGIVGGFLELADEIDEADTSLFDETVILAMRVPGNPDDPIGSQRVEEVARDLTALGGVTILTIIALVSFGAAVFSGRAKLGWAALAAVVLGTLGTSLLKSGYARPRPDLVEHGTWVSNASFPSGHSMMSAVVYLTLAILVARIQTRHRVRFFIVGVAVLLTVLVGISRVYLGVHWPTDVFAGWFLGAAWAVLFWLVAMKIDPRKARD
ncbi:phosphatase PAP2 family protein [Luteolibacter sp. AS25]|uniref:phosphatase PAP2 family protein n=1 Tax=Luteolibacter sp. AS25 TaxID=3135776 RepID=UPI00398B09ED